MKKNLRIVSAAAAALLAVAPVAASAVSVNAADSTATTTATNTANATHSQLKTTVDLGGNNSATVAQNSDVSLTTNFTAIAYVAGQNGAQGTSGVVSGSVSASWSPGERVCS